MFTHTFTQGYIPHSVPEMFAANPGCTGNFILLQLQVNQATSKHDPGSNGNFNEFLLVGFVQILSFQIRKYFLHVPFN